MAVTSGFFNSVDGDRTYDATDFSSVFSNLITDGVMGTYGTRFLVTANIGTRVLTVGTGRAWKINTWILNNTPYQVVIDAGTSLPRIDTVVLDFNVGSAYRANTIGVVKGTPAVTPTQPTLHNTTSRFQMPIAWVHVPANVTQITQGDITYLVGTMNSPLATGILGGLDADANILGWDALIRDWYNSVQGLVNSSDLTALTNKVYELSNRVQSKRNMIVNSGMVAETRTNAGGNSHSGITAYNDYPTAGPTMWRFNTNMAGTWTTSRVAQDNRYYFLANMTAAQILLSTAARTYISQFVDARRALQVYKGTSDAKLISLSFMFKSNRAGTYSVEIIDRATNTHSTKNFAYSSGMVNTAVRVTMEFPANTNPAAYLGAGYTPTTYPAYEIRFWLRAGTQYTTGSPQLAWGAVTDTRSAPSNSNNNTAGSTYFVGEVQLEPGKGSPFELVDDTDIYYERFGQMSGNSVVGVGTNVAGVTQVFQRFTKRYPEQPINVTVRSAFTMHGTTSTTLSTTTVPNRLTLDEVMITLSGPTNVLLPYTSRVVGMEIIIDSRPVG
jgi:hypothetical protein